MNSKGLFTGKKYLWIGLVLLIVIKIFSLDPKRVEALYSLGIYEFISIIIRALFGWMPFSFGDVLYFLAGCWLLWKLVKNTRLLFKRQVSGRLFLRKLLILLTIFIFILFVFNILWGLNYSRQGIAQQLQLERTTFDTSDVLILQKLLLEKVNAAKAVLVKENTAYPTKKDLFKRAADCYAESSTIFPLLNYTISSLKSSFYSIPGNYLGFTGYYNPFTGEAQVNTAVPRFLQPYIATHEIAHQLGYAKENEASFVGYLAAVNSSDTLFHYSTYLDLYIYANREVFYFDSVASKQSFSLLATAVKKDIEEWKQFTLSHRSFIEPAMTWMYDNYLKMNQQPQGMRSYNEVVFLLLKYYQKFGKI